MKENLIITSTDAVTIIKLNRPESRNSLDWSLVDKLHEALTKVGGNNDRVVILTGNGSAFCAGGDLKLMRDGFSPEGGRNYVESVSELVTRIMSLEKPVIAAVNGYAMGAGFSLALACDIIIASNEATFSQAFKNLALIPDSGGTFFLTRATGVHRAKELVFTGRDIAAEDALRMGFINRVVPVAELMGVTMELAKQLAKEDCVSMAIAKKLINHAFTGRNPLDRAIEEEVYAQGLLLLTEEHKKRVLTFFQKKENL